MVANTKWALAMAALCLLAGFSSFDATAMQGNGSPSRDFGHSTQPWSPPSSLREPLGATAVFYGDGLCANPPCVPFSYPGDCSSSPTCIPHLPLKVSSPYFGTPPDSDSGEVCYIVLELTAITWAPCDTDFRIPNPCAPMGWIHASDLGNETSTASGGAGTAIESITNLHIQGGAHVASGSIGQTPFLPPGFPANPFDPLGLGGTGRFHVSGADEHLESLGLAFAASGDPRAAEGPPDKKYVDLGHDGYILGRMEVPVQDKPGYDLHVATVDNSVPPGAFCLYGATHANGPFTLVHSAFDVATACTPARSFYGHLDHVEMHGVMKRNPSYPPETGCPVKPPGSVDCPPGTRCFYFDLSFFYTPLRTAMGLPDADRLDHFLVVNSIQRTPYLKTDFVIQPDNALDCLAPPGTDPASKLQPLSILGCPVTEPDGTRYVGYPNQVRGNLIGFTDTSTRFGYPLWQKYVVDQPTSNVLGTQADPWNRNSDPITTWQWNFESDPCGLAAGPLESVAFQSTRDALHRFDCPGIFPVCHSTFTGNQVLPPPEIPPEPISGPLLVVHGQADPPASVASMPPVRDSMYCKRVAIWNVPPHADFQPQSHLDDPYTFRLVDRSVDPDWIMRPTPGPGAYQRMNPTPQAATEFGVCPTCPPDGIQIREWDLDVDGIVDQRWEFEGRLVGASGTGVVLSGPFLQSDVGSSVRGDGIPAGTTIVGVPSTSAALLSGPVSTSGPVVVHRPFDALRDAPWLTHPRPGTYHANLRVCDHDHYVRETEPLFGSKVVSPNSIAPDMRVFMGDPYQGIDPRSGDPYLVWSDPDDHTQGGTNTHACDAVTKEYTIPNNRPHIRVPPNVVVTRGSVVSFTVLAWDVDRGQTLTLRLCPDQPQFAGLEFPTVGPLPENRLHQVFNWNLDGPVADRYGPVCFEVSDGHTVYRSGVPGEEVARAHSTIWIVGETQDTDMDGVADLADNCPGIPNPNQVDADADGIGDACAHEAVDEVVFVPHVEVDRGQAMDQDSDGVPDEEDNCMELANGTQEDLDLDGEGDACDPDLDGDGVANGQDNCPMHANPLQQDTERSGVGDSCSGALLLGSRGRTPALQGEATLAPGFSSAMAFSLLFALMAGAAVAGPLLRYALRERG